jgi:hypothetical protein
LSVNLYDEVFRGYFFRLFYFLMILLIGCQSGASVCAFKYSDLQKTEALKRLQQLIPETGIRGFVNGTQGSYFFIRSGKEELHMTFLTTGLFDLYGIKREGPVQFCDNNGRILVMGMGYEEEVVVNQLTIQLGGGTPRQTFREGPVPELLKQKHDLTIFLQSSI